jgi:hypothetical protein
MNSWKARRPPAWELQTLLAKKHISVAYHHLPSVQNVHEGNREHVGLLGAGEVGNVSVQRNVLTS